MNALQLQGRQPYNTRRRNGSVYPTGVVLHLSITFWWTCISNSARDILWVEFNNEMIRGYKVSFARRCIAIFLIHSEAIF